MNIEIASICDAATANSPDGRLNMLGAFDRVFPPKFPFVIPQCSAAFRVRYLRSEAGPHKLRLTFEDVCGHPIVPPMESEIPLKEVAPGFDTAAVNLVLNLQGLQIARPDKYIIRLAMDDEELVNLPLYILENPMLKQQREASEGQA